ncbi:AGAP013292-PA-like protein [Anopheles sinensis]|uniref:AGAP013292-PA-like protein n=1 Tax=Anopheles sinensis TaxID=74873 RepID=A0A084WE45_ANOSI|nr:AGAP013292-PA-like protein [Anopheles sinensis]
MAGSTAGVLISDLGNKDELYTIVLSELRQHGIKYRKEKGSKGAHEKAKCKRIFNAPLHTLELTDALLANGGIVQIPLFVSNACQFILDHVDTEGLFRKAGSSKRQQEIKTSVESGKPLGKSHHVIDVANIVKTFFRDLPEPLLPCGNVQEALIRCLLGSSKEQRVHKLLLTCLLLPPLTLNTLAYFMQFLHTVSKHSTQNRMTVENLAIILTPNIMPIAEMVQQRLTSHVTVVQLLIEHSHEIGRIPETILRQLKDDTSSNQSVLVVGGGDKKKKKRRSGSLTRMFNGFKKIVGAIGSSENLDKTDEIGENDPTLPVGTPCLSKSAKKRKVTEGIAFSAKKKEAKKSRLSLGGSKKPSKMVHRLLPSGSIPSIAEGKPMERRWSVVGAPWGRKKQNRAKIDDKVDTDAGAKTEDELELSDSAGKSLHAVGGRMSPVVSMPCLTTADESFAPTIPTKKADMSIAVSSTLETHDEADGGFLKIRRSEYEAIKKRVSDIETRISQEFCHLVGREDVLLDNVEDKYRQTLEQTEPIEATCSTTDQLAKRLSRELKIRASGEHKMIRSPSARKIGTIRRRSREAVRLSRNQSWHIGSTSGGRDVQGNSTANGAGGAGTVDLSFYPKPGVLKRGRPNTVQSGLRAPSESNSEEKVEPKKSPVKVITPTMTGGNFTDEEKEEKWVNAESYFDTHNVTVDSSSTVMDSTAEFLTPAKVLLEDYFKTPDTNLSSRRLSLRSSTKQQTPAFYTPSPFVTRIEVNSPLIKTPMLPPVVPPRTRTTPARTPKLPPRTPISASLRYPEAVNLLAKAHITPLQEDQSGRASIARIRSQNAGMVMAKAKLFDGLVTNAVHDQQHQNSGSSKRTTATNVNRRQSAKFRSTAVSMPAAIVSPRTGDGSVPRNSSVHVRQVQKLRSTTAHTGSPRKSTPRKRAFTKSAHGGGINRREKLRQASRGAASSTAAAVSSKVLSSPRIIRRIQENVQEQLSAASVSACLSPNVKDINSRPTAGAQCNKSNFNASTTTPHIRKQLLRNSPRRILAATPGRDNRLPHGDRYLTPMKATLMSRFALATETTGYEQSPERTPQSRAAALVRQQQQQRRSISASSVLRA